MSSTLDSSFSLVESDRKRASYIAKAKFKMTHAARKTKYPSQNRLDGPRPRRDRMESPSSPMMSSGNIASPVQTNRAEEALAVATMSATELTRRVVSWSS